MEDVFARIGLALEHLLHVAPVNGDQRAEVARLATELQAFEGSINTLIDERVRANFDDLQGRVVVLEEGVNRIGAKADEILAEQEASTADSNSGSDGALGAFDHDNNGAPGGSMPADETDDPAKMTVAQLTAAIEARGQEVPVGAKKAELQEVLMELLTAPTDPASSDPAPEQTADATASPSGPESTSGTAGEATA